MSMIAHRQLLVLLTLWGMFAGFVFPAAGRPGIEALTAGDPQTVFRWRTDRCARNHIPDAPARAFRDADDVIHLIAAHQINRAMIGPHLNRTRVDCKIVFRGNRNGNPESLDDLIWLTAFFTNDGRRIVALGHAEFHGHKHPNLCPVGTYMACWRNAVIAATSVDGGKNFSRSPGKAAAVASLPHDYDGMAGRHTGYFSPSNVISWNGHLYAFVFAEAYRQQRRGACLLRTKISEKPPVWRAWDGRDFTVALDRRPSSGMRNKTSACKPVAGIGSTITSVVRHQPSGSFIALFAGTRKVTAPRRQVTGVFYVQSHDLTTWSAPSLLIELPIMFRFTCGDKAVFGYPSLLGENSRSRNFDTVSDRAHLYLTRFNMAGCKLPMDRDLIRYPLVFRSRK